MKNFKLETFSADLEKADLMNFSETSNPNGSITSSIKNC